MRFGDGRVGGSACEPLQGPRAEAECSHAGLGVSVTLSDTGLPGAGSGHLAYNLVNATEELFQLALPSHHLFLFTASHTAQGWRQRSQQTLPAAGLTGKRRALAGRGGSRHVRLQDSAGCAPCASSVLSMCQFLLPSKRLLRKVIIPHFIDEERLAQGHCCRAHRWGKCVTVNRRWAEGPPQCGGSGESGEQPESYPAVLATEIMVIVVVKKKCLKLCSFQIVYIF